MACSLPFVEDAVNCNARGCLNEIIANFAIIDSLLIG